MGFICLHVAFKAVKPAETVRGCEWTEKRGVHIRLFEGFLYAVCSIAFRLGITL